MATTAPIESLASIRKYGLHIGGEQVDTCKYEEIKLPYDGTVVALVAQAAGSDVDSAVRSATQGAKAMAKMPNYERAELLHRIAEEVRNDATELARLICSETGKPIKEARTEASRSALTLMAAAHEARQLHGEVVPMDFAPGAPHRMAMTVREPIGIIGAITPFNFPLNLTLHKLAPALAAGNAVVHKPAERTPLSALRLAELVTRAGAPNGAYNVITGDGPALADCMLRHHDIAMITFTGSMEVGTEIRAKAGLKRVTLELGNNSAAIVEPDADLNLAVKRTVQGAFAHSGQVCISLQRVYVHESLVESFTSALIEATGQLVVGHPLEETTDISSLIDEHAAIRVEGEIQQAIESGAKLVRGGARKFSTIEPTILLNPPHHAHISCKEVFGPVLGVYTYRSIDEAIEEANRTPYGLQAGIFTNSLPQAFYVAKQLKFGGVLINEVPTFRMDHMPYGGTKGSGLGREGPKYAIEEMTELKLITWDVAAGHA